MEAKERIIVALDVDNLDEARELVKELSPYVGYFKIGLELLIKEGAPKVVQAIKEVGGKIFYDGKFNDIPTIVAGASKTVAKLGVDFFSVHASSGKESVAKAVANKGNCQVLGVTVLTSISPEECLSIFGEKPGPKVLQFAQMLAEVGADGIICSPEELELLGQQPELAKLLKVTPGVRPLWAADGNQKRVMTPGEAIKAGANYLVIGRPITQPPAEIGDPVEAVKKITEEIIAAIEERGTLAAPKKSKEGRDNE